MKLVTYRSHAAGEGRLGVVENGLVIDVAALGAALGQPFAATMLDFIDQGPDAISALQNALKDTAGKRPVGISFHEETCAFWRQSRAHVKTFSASA